MNIYFVDFVSRTLFLSYFIVDVSVFVFLLNGIALFIMFLIIQAHGLFRFSN